VLNNIEIFDVCIVRQAITTASELKVDKFFERYRHFLRDYGGKVLSMKVLHSNDSSPYFVKAIRKNIAYMLDHQSTDGKERHELRNQYRLDICTAFTVMDFEAIFGKKQTEGLEFWESRDMRPSLAASVGNIGMLRDSLTLPHLTPPYSKLFPNALDASIAADKNEALKFILRWLKTNVKGKHETGSWNDMRNATRTITNAARVAVRLHKTAALGALLQFLADNHVFNRSTNLYFEENLIKDCMRHGNAELIYIALVFDRKQIYEAPSDKKLVGIKLTRDEEEFLFRHGHPHVLRGLIKYGLLELDGHGTPPVQQCLQWRNYRMARILLTHGAKVDVIIDKKTNETSLGHAASGGYVDDVKLLLEYGANPVHRATHGTPLNRATMGRRFNKCAFLLEKVHKYGKDYVKRPDLWSIYDEESLRKRSAVTMARGFFSNKRCGENGDTGA
jgi:hypothetical protein